MLEKIDNSFFISKSKPFEPIKVINEKYVTKVFEFSFGMTFGQIGEHRKHRSGGQVDRNPAELFLNTFQGKLAEFGIYDYFSGNGFIIDEPDLAKWELGKWDTVDLVINQKKVNIKSTKYFGNLLLYETKDWNIDGLYIPNIQNDGGYYDYFLLIRISPNTDNLMPLILENSNYSNFFNLLKEFVCSMKWEFDIPGYMTDITIRWLINNKRILPQNSLLNGKIKMDAENYYIETGDLKEIKNLIKDLKSL